MTLKSHWNDLTPSKRCDWIDQLRGWAVIVMIEVHCVNVWLKLGLLPGWLNYVNGLVAPAFLTCAGFSLVLSVYRADGTLRPFFPDTAKRLGFILVCAYILHAPGLTLADWTLLAFPQKYLELFKVDVLQCVVFSLLILHGLARAIRSRAWFGTATLALAVWIALLSPMLWMRGIGDGLWMPIRGLLNGNLDRGVQSLFPLFPWFSFPAFGAVLGCLYDRYRVQSIEGKSRLSELQGLGLLGLLGLGFLLFGNHFKETWLWHGQWIQEGSVSRLHGFWGAWTWSELMAIHNTTLPSVLERLGWILLAGALLGVVERLRPAWKGTNPVACASRESLLLYMLHLNLIFGLLLAPAVVGFTGWDWNSLGWMPTLALTTVVIGLNLLAGVAWQRIRKDEAHRRSLQRKALALLAIWFLAGGWWKVRYYLLSPELAREPYAFLNMARARKGLPPTPDGLCQEPEEYFREAERRNLRINPVTRAKITQQIQRRKARH